MRKHCNKVAMTALAFVLGTSAASAAQMCLSGDVGAGVVQDLAGNVMVSSASGAQAAQPGVALQAGSRLMTGPNSAAVVYFGAHAVRVPANSTLQLTSRPGQICYDLATSMKHITRPPANAAQGASNAAGAAAGLGGLQAPAIVGGVVLLGGGIAAAVAIASEDDKVSD